MWSRLLLLSNQFHSAFRRAHRSLRFRVAVYGRRHACARRNPCALRMAAGITGKSLTAEEVFETGARVKNQFIALLKAVIPKIAAAIG